MSHDASQAASHVLLIGRLEGSAVSAAIVAAERGGASVQRHEATTSNEVLDALGSSDAGLAVVGATLETLHGADGWRRLRSVWSRPIIVIHGAGDDVFARAALEDGAEDALGSDDPTLTVLLDRAVSRALTRGRLRRPELELDELRARWLALDSAKSWYVMEIDDANRITYLNRKAVGVPDREYLGESVFTWTHPDAHELVRERLAHVRRTGEAVVVEERGHGTVGDASWFVARCLPVRRDDRVASILVVTEDVTERYQLQQQLSHSERRFRALIERSSDVIVLLDRDGRTRYASPATERVLGYDPTDLVGTDFTSLIHPDDIESVLAARETIHATANGHVTKEVRLRHKDGTFRLVQGVGTNLLDDPAVGAVVGNYRDVTGQRVLEEQVRRAQQWDAMGLLAGGIAHDFNNLLCVILASATIAKSTSPNPSRELVALDDIVQAATRAAELTRKLLALGRSQPLAMEYVDVAEVVDGFASLIRRSLGENVELDVSCAGPLPVRVDRLQIEQVLLNVCTNARQAIDGSGRVTIEARCTDGVEGARVVEIAIRDDGPGMDDATLRRVFDPFFTTKRDGSGLGLTVSYGIVERHGGKMVIDSVPGRGTMVTVQLPAQEGPRKATGARRAPVSHSNGATTVLVAEDEPILRRLVCRMLRAAGYRAVEAEDGSAAVAMLAAEPNSIGLALLDVRMPTLSGPAAYELMTKLRPELPVLFMTGHAPNTESLPSAAHLIMKPFTNEALLEAINELCGDSRIAD